ncbi:MAG: haloacid dehalogenase [Pirellula sp.]|nr:haloacid dehalogenase [Pirellula sp.]
MTENLPTQVAPFAAVLFDAVGTLIHPEPSVADAYHTAGLRHGSRLTRDEVHERFQAVFAAEEALDAASGMLRTDEARELRRWRTIVSTTFLDVPADRHEALFQDLWRHFARPSSWRAFDDAVPTIERLQADGVIVAVGSNFDERLLPIVAELLPSISADAVFASSRLGYRKPAAEFFERCITRLGLATRNQLLIVGDDADNDALGPRKLGFSTLFLDRRNRTPDLTPRITTLNDLSL